MKAADFIEAAKLAALLVGGYVAWKAYDTVKKKGAQDVAAAAVNVVGDFAAGAVKGTASLFGVPDTDISKCSAAKASGNTWDASFYCPASDWVSYLVSGGSSSSTAQARVATQADADAWATTKAAAYGQKSFTDTINSDPYNLLP